MVFYRAKADALDESSHLQGRTEGTEITSARRSRAVGGVLKMTMKQLGGLGVGRVAGYLHPARSTTRSRLRSRRRRLEARRPRRRMQAESLAWRPARI